MKNLDNISKERLADLFLHVLNDALEAAEPWYHRELILNLGITKEEAKALDIEWVLNTDDADEDEDEDDE